MLGMNVGNGKHQSSHGSRETFVCHWRQKIRPVIDKASCWRSNAEQGSFYTFCCACELCRLKMDKSEPTVVEANVGERVRLPCTVEASPTLNIEWQKDGQPLSSPRWAPGQLQLFMRRASSLLFLPCLLSVTTELLAMQRGPVWLYAVLLPPSGPGHTAGLPCPPSLTDGSLNVEPLREQLWHRIYKWARA